MKRAVAVGLLCACGAATPSPLHPQAKANRVELERFLADEESALTLLAAADPRIAARGVTADPNALHHAAMGAILAEDPTLAMEGNRPDVFSFEVRARALDMADAFVAKWKTPPSDPDAASALRPALEIELLGRLIASEKLRLASERNVPLAASALLGGLAATWQAPELKDLGPRDDWLSRRLGEVTQSMGPQSLTMLERDELDDALDPLERAIGDALPKSRAAMVGLRVAVERLEPAPRAKDRWSAIDARLRADAGSLLSADTLLALFVTEAKALRDEVGLLVVKVTEDLAARAGEKLVGLVEPCHAQNKTGSRVRALEPPPERAFDCALRRWVIAAHTADDNLEVLVAMHDAVLGAVWAVVLGRGGDATTLALATPKPIAPMSPTVEGKLMRFAATHPVEAITRALSIGWIMRNGLAEAGFRAEAWSAFGDAPLDVIEREVHPPAGPREKPHFKQTSR